MTEFLVGILIAVVFGFAFPAIGIRMLARSLEEGPRAENYRGRPVFAGLGIVWLLWAISAVVGDIVRGSLFTMQLSPVPLAAVLALAAFALGLIDDAYGTSAEKGFRGHLKALASGRLTTGGLKLFGISLVSYVAALTVGMGSESLPAGTAGGWLAFIVALIPGAAIALTANLLNLTDLRPGRALKVYSVLVVVALLLSAIVATVVLRSLPDLPTLGGLVVYLIFLLGPAIAAWPYDLGERGMLGDAGANAAGVVAGFFIVLALPLWGIVVYLLLVLALNLASERMSFSEVIARTPILRRFDAWGRLDAEQIASRAPRSRRRGEGEVPPHGDSPE